MMEGFIKLSRKLLENPIWNEKPYTRGQAWVDLLMLANWKDSKVLDGNSFKTVKRGTVVRSKKWLADRWGWDRKKLSTYLALLESDKMVTTDGTTHGTTITIENYSKYQDVGTTDGTTTPHQMGQQLPTNSPHMKNSNKDNKEKNILQRETSKEKVLVIPDEATIMGIHYVNGVQQCPQEETKVLLSKAHADFADIKRKLMRHEV